MNFLREAAAKFGGLLAGSSVTVQTPQGVLQFGKRGASLQLGRFTAQQEAIGIAVAVGVVLWIAGR